MKKITRKTPQSVKTQRKIDAALAQQEEVNRRNVALMLNRHLTQIEMLKKPASAITPDYLGGLDRTQQVKKSLLPVRDPVHGLLTPDAKQSWKRYSNITLALIIATQAFFASLDPVVVAALPDNIQYYIGIIQALVGIGASVINQTKRGKGAADV